MTSQSATITGPEVSTLVHDEVAFLRDQLATCSRLLKCSLKANRPFDPRTRAKVDDLMNRIEHSLDAKDRQLAQEQSRIHRLGQQASELQTLIGRHEEMTRGLQRQLKSYEAANAELTAQNASLKSTLETLKTESGRVSEDFAKASAERDVSKDQNKKLVELLQRMERKITDKSNREEELEEQNLQLKEMTKIMSGQVERIERELESKLRKKDDLIAELQGRFEAQEAVKKYNLDLEQDLQDLEELESQLLTSKK